MVGGKIDPDRMNGNNMKERKEEWKLVELIK